MVPELGHFSLILALCLAVTLGVLPLVGAFRGNNLLMSIARPLAQGQFLFVVFAFGCLIYSFVTSDFSVQNVAANSNSKLPYYYRVTASWGSHEGSLLLWILMLTGWTFAVSVFSRNLPLEVIARVLSVMGLVAVGFHLFLLLTSNPFDRLLPAARKLFPLGEPVDATTWLGSRPCIADSRPVIGPAPGHPGLWLAYGHAHWGMTLGPATGRLVAEMMTKVTPFCDPAPYRAERLIR